MTKVRGRIVRPGAVVPGHVEMDGPVIVDVVEDRTAGDDVIVPGFVDLHCHGGGGHTFTTGDPDAARGAAAFHLAHGTTTMLASLVSSPFELMRAATEAYMPLVAEGVLAGVHYEGPYLSQARCGAQNPSFLRDPSPDELTQLLKIGQATVRMVTIAPDLPGAPEAIRLLRAHGVLPALGHTDATYEQTLAAIAAGAAVGTHVFNGMPPPHHREPGPVIALLSPRPDAPPQPAASPQRTDSPQPAAAPPRTASPPHTGSPRNQAMTDGPICELIADNIHLHPGMLAFAARTAGPDRAALITDAVDATGMPDGVYELGGQEVIVADRVARLARNGAIAGSTLTMDAALRNTVAAGIPLPDAVTMASTTPARALGLADQVGALHVGMRADLVVLSPSLEIRRVMRAGRWVK